jgi:hypothetical protein
MHVSVKGNPVILAVIVVVPAIRALTTPMEEMDAILGLELVQATATLETYWGVTVASKLYD